MSDKAPSSLPLVALWWGDGGEALMSCLPRCCVERETGLTQDIALSVTVTFTVTGQVPGNRQLIIIAQLRGSFTRKAVTVIMAF